MICDRVAPFNTLFEKEDNQRALRGRGRDMEPELAAEDMTDSRDILGGKREYNQNLQEEDSQRALRGQDRDMEPERAAEDMTDSRDIQKLLEEEREDSQNLQGQDRTLPNLDP